jgi:hypothetical protein
LSFAEIEAQQIGKTNIGSVHGHGPGRVRRRAA